MKALTTKVDWSRWGVALGVVAVAALTWWRVSKK